MFRYILRRSLTYLVMVFLTTTMGYFAAVTTLKPALLEQEKVPRPSPEQVNRTLASLGLDSTDTSVRPRAYPSASLHHNI